MKKSIQSLLAAVAGVSCATIAQAQPVDSTYAFQPGDIISVREGDPSTYRIVSCEPASERFRECSVVRLTPFLEDHERPLTMENYTLAIVGPADAVATAPTGNAPPAAKAVGGNTCPKTPYGGPVPGTRPASAALFKQKIADSTTMAAYGNFWYGVEFDAFSVGAPIKNTVGVRAGDGTNRVTNGAPAGATLYPVSATVRVCEGAPSGSSSWRTRQSKYFCFVSSNKEWTCGATA